jgi:hypothetical protein
MKGGEEMRKTVIGIMVLTLLLITAAAFARPWGPGGKNIEITAEQQKFFDETRDLRKQMHDKKFELREAYRAQNPDEKKIAALETDVNNLREKIQGRANELGVEPGSGFKGRRGNAAGYCCNGAEKGDFCQNQGGGCGRQGRI